MRSHLAREGIEDPAFEFVCEPKIDGLAISLLYRDGVLDRGATRGNGEIGEDVTHNLRTIAPIPLRIPRPPPLVEVRGEIYMSLPDFAALNERRAAAGLQTFMNPRNSAAGTIRQLDPALAAERPLSMLAYGIGATEGIAFDTHWDGARLAARAAAFRSTRTSAAAPARTRSSRSAWPGSSGAGALDFEIDGVVVKVDRPRAPAAPGRRRARPALGDRLEVPADDGEDARCARSRWNVGKFGDLHPFADARAGRRRRRHRQAGDAAQRGGPRAARTSAPATR